MITTTELKVKRTSHSKLKDININDVVFGTVTSDHMFACSYRDGEWTEPEIVPYQDVTLSPSALVLHYGQSCFEGMKAYRMQDGRINIFRLERHHERLNKTLKRMCMPEISYSLFEDALSELVQLDSDWIPSAPGSSLYIRPFMFATEAKFGIKVSEEYKFIIITGPVGPFYQKPLKVKVERDFIRAARGGTGFAKCSGNYGGALYPSMLAKKEGYDQVIWTDSVYNRYIEESGTMNVMFVIDDVLITPPLSDSIIDGVTRDTILQMARDRDIPCLEKPISADELITAFENGSISEAFGTGTAVVVAPIQTIGINGVDYNLPPYSHQSYSSFLKKELEDTRTGRKQDHHNWNYIIKRGR